MKTLKQLALLPLFLGLVLTTACTEQYENGNGTDNGYYNGGDNGNGDTPFNRTITAVVENGNNYNNLISRVAITLWTDDDDSEHTIATGTWSNGGFTITLPETLNTKFLTPVLEAFDQDQTIDISDISARWAVWNGFRAYNEQGRRVGRIHNKMGGCAGWNDVMCGDNTCWAHAFEMFFVYADRDVTTAGELTFNNEYGSSTFNINMQLRAGWNKLYQTIEREETNGRHDNTALSTEPISGLYWSFNIDTIVCVQNIVLSQTRVYLFVGNSLAVTATILPEYASYQNIIWTSSDNSVATVSNTGVITAVSLGHVQIFATPENGWAMNGVLVSTFGSACNTNTPGWGENLGTVTRGTQEWVIEGNGIRQIWSDAVTATNCQKTTFNVETWGDSYSADCRSNPNFPGDLFSFCAVVRFADQLCPYPWRVPTYEDFSRLNIAFGGTAFGGNVHPDFITENYINRWGGAFSGGVQYPGTLWQEEVGRYWSQSGMNDRTAFSLMFTPNEVRVNTIDGNKFNGMALRCVRDKE